MFNGYGPRSDDDPRARDHERWPQRHGDPRDRDPRDVFMRDFDLPRGREREIVYDARDREYTLRGSETRTLSTVGAFRVVSARDLRDHLDRPADPRSGDLRHLREQGLIDTVRLDGRRDVAIVLTERGRDLLEHHRDRDADTRQELYAASNANASSNTTPRCTTHIRSDDRQAAFTRNAAKARAVSRQCARPCRARAVPRPLRSLR
jgi:DNA-binding MarR family transcriptional regulator